LFAEAGVSRELEDPNSSFFGLRKNYVKKLGREGYDDEIGKTRKKERLRNALTGGISAAILC
jgi:hypothetical protein